MKICFNFKFFKKKSQITPLPLLPFNFSIKKHPSRKESVWKDVNGVKINFLHAYFIMTYNQRFLNFTIKPAWRRSPSSSAECQKIHKNNYFSTKVHVHLNLTLTSKKNNDPLDIQNTCLNRYWLLANIISLYIQSWEKSRIHYQCRALK